MRRVGVLMLTAWATVGCYSWKNVTLVENADPATRPDAVEVTVNNGARYTLFSPVIRSDSLHGFSDKRHKMAASFAVSEVRSARTQQVSGERTALGVLMGLAAVVGIWVLLILTSGGLSVSI